MLLIFCKAYSALFLVRKRSLAEKGTRRGRKRHLVRIFLENAFSVSFSLPLSATPSLSGISLPGTICFSYTETESFRGRRYQSYCATSWFLRSISCGSRSVYSFPVRGWVSKGRARLDAFSKNSFLEKVSSAPPFGCSFS